MSWIQLPWVELSKPKLDFSQIQYWFMKITTALKSQMAPHDFQNLFSCSKTEQYLVKISRTMNWSRRENRRNGRSDGSGIFRNNVSVGPLRIWWRQQGSLCKKRGSEGLGVFETLRGDRRCENWRASCWRHGRPKKENAVMLSGINDHRAVSWWFVDVLRSDFSLPIILLIPLMHPSWSE